MPENEKKEGFWTSLPGMLTGLAALITAITGLWLALAPHGSSPKSEPAGTTASAPSQTSGATPPKAEAPPAGASTSPESQTMPTAEAATHTAVTVTSRKNQITKLSAASFRHNMTDDAIQLSSGQTIALESIRAIDFLSVNEVDHLVGVRVLLANGRMVDGALTIHYAFTGESDLGPFTIFVQDIKRIQFE